MLSICKTHLLKHKKTVYFIQIPEIISKFTSPQQEGIKAMIFELY